MPATELPEEGGAPVAVLRGKGGGITGPLMYGMSGCATLIYAMSGSPQLMNCEMCRRRKL
eukprot:2933668-Prorocentrum_lima.AAC.1